jgi:pimeloyl-ACP methyl ester carboxylesterase
MENAMPKETPNIVLLSEWKQTTRLNLIFVHGLSGNLFETWKSNNTDTPEKGIMWPQWLVEDNPGTAAYAYGYNAPMAFWQRGGRMTLGQRAENLRSNIDGRELFDKPCVLICHSLGGLVVKRMLLDLQKTATTGNAEQQKRRAAQLANVRGVVFIATPHYGSKLAITLDRFLFISSTSVESLKYGNSELISIQSDYVNFAATYKDISHIQYTESGLTSGLRVVDPLSGRAPIAFIETNQTDDDHVQIVKPKDKQDQVYAGIDTYISRLMLAIPADENGQPGELQHTEIPPTPKPKRAGIYLGITALGLVAAASIFTFVPTWLRPVLPCNIAV